MSHTFDVTILYANEWAVVVLVYKLPGSVLGGVVVVGVIVEVPVELPVGRLVGEISVRNEDVRTVDCPHTTSVYQWEKEWL